MFQPSLVRLSARISSLLAGCSAACAVVAAMVLSSACPHAVAQAAASQPTSYTITDLGVLPGGYYRRGDGSKCFCSAGQAVNTAGQVAGDAYTQSTQGVAALFSAGTVKNLGVIHGAVSSIGSGLAGYGRVTGSLQFFSPTRLSYDHAFLYSSGVMKDLGTLAGDISSDGNAINDSGQVAGTSQSASYISHAFLYGGGTMRALGDLPRDLNSYGEAINASSQIAGAANLPGENRLHAVVFNGSSVKDLGALAGGDTSYAYGINDSGQVTGLSFADEDQYFHAFLYSKGKMKDLGTLSGDIHSIGLGINASGQVVGSSQGADERSFLYTPERGMVDVATLLPRGSKWTGISATAINDLGQIAGTATDAKGYQHAFLLSPVRTNFSTLNTALDLIGKPATTFAVGGRFTLSANNKAIDPETETIVLQLSGYHIAIPPASLVKTDGNYIFNGKIGNVALGMILRPVGTNAYLFGIEGVGAAGLPTAYPVQLTLTIGGYNGTEKIAAGYPGPPPTPAQLCQYFHLDCSE